MIRLLLLASLAYGSTQTVRIDDTRVRNLSLDVRALQSGRPTLTGLPTFQTGFCFGDGSCQTTAGMPVGAIIAYASGTIPSGWLECNGVSYPTASYPQLYASIGCSWGCSGTPVDHFNVPDLRGRFLRGWDHTAGNDPDAATRTASATGGATGDNVGSVQASTFTAHTHNVAAQSYGGGSGGTNAWQDTGFPGAFNTASAGGDETRPTNANVVYIIRSDNGGAVLTSNSATPAAIAYVDAPILGDGTNSNHLRLDPSGTLPAMNGSLLTSMTESQISGLVADLANKVDLTEASSVTFQNAAFSVGGSTLVVTGGKVGIGDSTPANALSVAGIIGHTGGVISEGGNARGAGATDLQSVRSQVTYVASGANSTIGGGADNSAPCTGCTVAGGYSGNIGSNNSYAFIGGGYELTIDDFAGEGAGICSGNRNRIYNDGGNSPCYIGGGGSNSCGEGSVVNGGYGNSSLVDHGVIGGGWQNANSGAGDNCTIGGGLNNICRGNWGTIPGGNLNAVYSQGGFAAGSGAKVSATGSFAMSDQSGTHNKSTDTFQAYFASGYNLLGGPLSVTSTITAVGRDASGYSIKASSGINASAGCLLLQGGQLCGPVAGPTGASGASGAQGLSGASGATGASGEAGASGATGASGDQGLSGASGATGASGDAGASGATGASGAQGVSGASGAAGAQGDSGASGSTGASGAQGLTGDSGATGATGDSGASGATGASGAVGATGASGVSGSSGATGASGANGQAGASGATGNTGNSGATGNTGASGATGLTGASGATGATGAAGASGASNGWTADGTNVYVTDTADKVGIGTTNPARALEVVSASSTGTAISGYSVYAGAGSAMGSLLLGNNNAFAGRLDYDSNNVILSIDNTYDSTASKIRFRTRTNGTPVENLTMTGAGLTGIGTTNPGQKLHISAATGNPGMYITVDDSNYISILFAQDYDGSPNYASVGQGLDGSLRLSGGSSVASPHMTILDGGNVGVNTTNPSTSLDVNGRENTRGTSWGNPAGPNTMNIDQGSVWAKSIDGVSQSSSCVVVVSADDASSTSQSANLTFTSTTTVNTRANHKGTFGVLLETCAPGSFCRVGIRGIYYVCANAGGISSGHTASLSTTRCKTATNANDDANTVGHPLTPLGVVGVSGCYWISLK